MKSAQAALCPLLQSDERKVHVQEPGPLPVDHLSQLLHLVIADCGQVLPEICHDRCQGKGSCSCERALSLTVLAVDGLALENPFNR